jgi:hypothetical protein
MPPQNVPTGGAESDDLYLLLEELDRLEDLLEEMADLGVASREEVEQRMTALNVRVDELSGA